MQCQGYGEGARINQFLNTLKKDKRNMLTTNIRLYIKEVTYLESINRMI